MNGKLHEQLRQLYLLGVIEDVLDLGPGEGVHIFLQRDQACPLEACAKRTFWLILRDDVVRCPDCDRAYTFSLLPPAVREAAERAFKEMG